MSQSLNVAEHACEAWMLGNEIALEHHHQKVLVTVTRPYRTIDSIYVSIGRNIETLLCAQGFPDVVSYQVVEKPFTVYLWFDHETPYITEFMRVYNDLVEGLKSQAPSDNVIDNLELP